MTQMTLQQAFDKVVHHCLTANAKSTGGCRMSGAVEDEFGNARPDGSHCAVGYLIPDHEWSRSCEGGVHHTNLNIIAAQISDATRETVATFLKAMMSIHDHESVADWPARFAAYAERAGLKFNPPTKPVPVDLTAVKAFEHA